MSSKHQDFTPVVDLTVASGAGATRQKKPRYVTLTPPCSNVCPAGENIREWLSAAQAGRYQEAWEILTAEKSDASRAWQGVLSPVRRRMQTVGRWMIRFRSTRWNDFLAIWPTRKNWAFKKIRPESGKKSSCRRCRAIGSIRRLSLGPSGS